MGESGTIWSVGGGKGGIGKSVTSLALACALAQSGRRVVIVDADLGGANLHTYFGLRFPDRTLEDFLKGRVDSLEDAATETPQAGLRLISGGGEFIGIANPAYSQKQRLISNIRRLDADNIIVDLGAGSSHNVLDFFAMADMGIIVLAPEPAAIQNAYVFLKSFVYRIVTRLFSANRDVLAVVSDGADSHGASGARNIDELCAAVSAVDRGAAESLRAELSKYSPAVIVNMAQSRDDERVGTAFGTAAKAFLSLDTFFAGMIYSRPGIKAAARKMRPYMLDSSAKDAQEDVRVVVERLLDKTSGQKDVSLPIDVARGLEATLAGAGHAKQGAVRPQGEAKAGVAEKSVVAPPPAKVRSSASLGEVFGFNDNVRHNGAIYHVQTEVYSGADGFVETVVYHGGRIFFSKKTGIADAGADLRSADLRSADLREFAARQHKSAIAAVRLNKIEFRS